MKRYAPEVLDGVLHEMPVLAREGPGVGESPHVVHERLPSAQLGSGRFWTQQEFTSVYSMHLQTPRHSLQFGHVDVQRTVKW